MTKPHDLDELATKVEAASGPDRELDVAIWLAAVADPMSLDAVKRGREQFGEAEAEFRISRMMDGLSYTVSLDAAMTLVPEGWRFAGSETIRGGFYAHLITRELTSEGAKAHALATADTLPLAICAAALRAREGEG